MAARFRKSSYTQNEFFDGQHRFEHWYRDNTFYFITSKARDGRPVFQSRAAREVFWDRFAHYTRRYDFRPFVATLLSNHYHTIGYLQVGENLGGLMQKLHGSVAKLVNDLLPERHLPFWRTRGNKDYFDGCLRSELQLRRTYRYVLMQAQRHGVASRWQDYPDTHVRLSLDQAIALGHQVKPYLERVPYQRYDHHRR